MSMLPKVEIFAGLSEEEQAALENSCVTRNYPRNTVVINENDFADSLYVIESGRVKVYCSDKNGKEYIMNTLGPGERHPNIATTLIRNLTRRVRKLTENVKSLALQDVYGRVTKVLMTLAEPRGDKLYIEERLTQQDIADRVGASREMVARILKDLAIGDYIAFEGKNIIINGKLPTSY